VASTKVASTVAFLSRFLAHPKRVGAVFPSSPQLAAAIAAAADLSGEVLELGPGSGAVTRALLAAGLKPGRLTAIEYDSRFANDLRARYPGITVLEGDAFAFRDCVGAMRFSSVVSGLPLLNYSRERGVALIADALAATAGPFVQFSYGLSAPVPPPQGATVKKAARIWTNLPPAAVWVYRARA
jgi:phosphatidylethanolamine/phosphatidyl-N-methylethanolamine N-methyltransferase